MTDPAQYPPGFDSGPGFYTPQRVRAAIAILAILVVTAVPIAMVAYIRANPPQVAEETDDDEPVPAKEPDSTRHKPAVAAAADPVGSPKISLVLLLRQPYAITDNDVRLAAQKAYTIRLGRTAAEDNFVIRVKPNTYVVMVRGSRRFSMRLSVEVSSKPYSDDPDAFAATCPVAAMRPLISQHKAWLSVEWFGDVDDSNRAGVYRTMGLLLGQFAGNNTLAIYASENGAFRRFDPKVPGMLIDGSPVDDFVDHVPNR
jgi:hypothetical protein